MTCASRHDHSAAVRAALSRGVQRTVTVGSAHDPAEHEADAVADRVQRASVEEEREQEVQREAVEEPREEEVQRVAEEPEEDEVQRLASVDEQDEDEQVQDEQVQRAAVEQEREEEVQRASAGDIDDGPLSIDQIQEPEPAEGTATVPPAPEGQAPTTEDEVGDSARTGPIGSETLAIEPPEGLDASDVLDKAEVADEVTGGEKDEDDAAAADGPTTADADGGAAAGEAGGATDEPATDEPTVDEPAPGPAGPAVQRKAMPGAEGGADGGADHAPLDLEQLRAPTGGEPVSETVRRRVEPVLGADLGHVHVHRGPDAEHMADRLGACAFTLGSHVWLGRGASQADTRLMAHELTHVVQQRAAPHRPRGPPTRSRRHASRRAPTARVGPAAPATSRDGGQVVRRGRLSRGWGWIKRKVASYADELPGYRVLAFVLGRDPITGTNVPRTGAKLLWALEPILPNSVIAKLRESGAADKVVAEVSSAWAELRSSLPSLSDLLRDTWDAVSLTSRPSTNWKNVKRVWAPPFRTIRRFVVRVGKAVLRFIFEAVVAAVGPKGRQVLDVVLKVGRAIGMVVSHPLRFVKNLVRAVSGGFSRFFHRIKEHLRDGFIDWLTGTLSSAGVELPKTWDLRGVIGLGMQLLGLTWANVRQRLVRQLKPDGERKVALLEKVVEAVRTVASKGIRGIIPLIQRKLTGLIDTIKTSVMRFISIEVAKRAAAELATFLVPGAGALIVLARKIYDVVSWVIDNFRRMLGIVSSIGNAMADIARGAVGTAAGAIERALAGFVPTLISLFARFVGLSGLPNHIRRLLKNLSKPINRLIDKVVAAALKLGKSFFARAKSAAKRSIAWFKRRLPFGRGTHRHTILFGGTPKQPKVDVQSKRMPFRRWLETQIPTDGKVPPEAAQLRAEVTQRLDEFEATVAASTAKSDGSRVNARLEKLRLAAQAFADHLADSQKTPLTQVTYGNAGSIEVSGKAIPVGTSMTAAPLTTAGPSGSSVRNPRASALWAALRRRRQGKRTFWIQGHLLNNNLHGAGNEPRNLTPISQAANQDHERRVESAVKAKAKAVTGTKENRTWPVIDYRVTVEYSGERNVPDADVTGLGVAAATRVSDTVAAERQLATAFVCEAYPMYLTKGRWTEDTSDPIVSRTTIPNTWPTDEHPIRPR